MRVGNALTGLKCGLEFGGNARRIAPDRNFPPGTHAEARKRRFALFFDFSFTLASIDSALRHGAELGKIVR